jgi:hypothetical protein
VGDSFALERLSDAALGIFFSLLAQPFPGQGKECIGGIDT